MDNKELRLKHLEEVMNSVATNDTEAASAAFHNWITVASKPIIEGCDPKSNPGEKAVADTLKMAGDKEIKKTGEAKDCPKDAPGEKCVADTLKCAGDDEIEKTGEAKDCPKDAPGEKAVADTLKMAGDKEIK